MDFVDLVHVVHEVDLSICDFGGSWTRTNGDRSRGIYSPLQLPLCDTPEEMMLAVRLELTTARLQVGCSTS